jgi:hypothetical protein
MKNKQQVSRYLLVVLLFLFADCDRFSGKVYLKELRQVDSLLVQAQNIHDYLFALDTLELEKQFEQAEEDFIWVRDSVFNRIGTQENQFLYTLKSARKAKTQYEKNFSKIKAETTYSISQLTSLRKDIKNKSLDLEMIQTYLKDEEKALQSISSFYKDFKVRIELVQKSYDQQRKKFEDTLLKDEV